MEGPDERIQRLDLSTGEENRVWEGIPEEEMLGLPLRKTQRSPGLWGGEGKENSGIGKALDASVSMAHVGKFPLEE